MPNVMIESAPIASTNRILCKAPCGATSNRKACRSLSATKIALAPAADAAGERGRSFHISTSACSTLGIKACSAVAWESPAGLSSFKGIGCSMVCCVRALGLIFSSVL